MTSSVQGGLRIPQFRLFLGLTIVFLAGLFIYGLWLGESPLDRTEPFRALVAHQMVKGGSWLVPRLYGELYLRKPPLIYWIEAIVEKLSGRGDEFVWRLPSAVGSALLAVFVAWWSSRWFGPRALLPAGFACLALIALWDQDRGADIDALNTAFAVVTTACVLELLYGLRAGLPSSRPGRYGRGLPIVFWCIVLGLSLAATLLLKGPGGLPQIVAAIVGPAILLADWKPLIRRAIAIGSGMMLGIAIFSVYVFFCKAALRQMHVGTDRSGSQEVMQKIFQHSWVERLGSLAMPLELLAFALPVSLVLPFAMVLLRRLPPGDPGAIRALALMGTLAAGAFIWLLGGNDNPRYEYVMLPLLAPLVGFVWTRWERRGMGFGQMLIAIAVLMCGAYGVLLGKLPGSVHPLLIHAGFGIALAAVFGLVLTFARAKALATQSASPVVIFLLLLLAIPMAARKNAERLRKSAKAPAAQLRSIIGNSPRVSASGVVRDLPELFYYADVDVDAYGEIGLPELLRHRGHWIVVSQGEQHPAYSTIMKFIPGAFPRGVTKLKMPDPRDEIYVGWYDPPAGVDTNIHWTQNKPAEPDD